MKVHGLIAQAAFALCMGSTIFGQEERDESGLQ